MEVAYYVAKNETHGWCWWLDRDIGSLYFQIRKDHDLREATGELAQVIGRLHALSKRGADVTDGLLERFQLLCQQAVIEV